MPIFPPESGEMPSARTLGKSLQYERHQRSGSDLYGPWRGLSRHGGYRQDRRRRPRRLRQSSAADHDDADGEGVRREQATILLARRTRTMKRCSFDARSEGQFACSL